jgi:hypothetical protein
LSGVVVGWRTDAIATIEILAEKLPHLQLLNAYAATETTSPSTIMPRHMPSMS